METPGDHFETPASPEADSSVQGENDFDVVEQRAFDALRRGFPGIEIVEQDDEYVLKDKDPS